MNLRFYEKLMNYLIRLIYERIETEQVSFCEKIGAQK